MFSQVVILGNLGAEPKIKYTQDGVTVAVLSIAVDSFVRRNGSYEKITDWFQVVAFGRVAEFCSKLKKGDAVFILGKLRTRTLELESKTFKLVTIVAHKVFRVSRRREKDEIFDEEDGTLRSEDDLKTEDVFGGKTDIFADDFRDIRSSGTKSVIETPVKSRNGSVKEDNEIDFLKNSFPDAFESKNGKNAHETDFIKPEENQEDEIEELSVFPQLAKVSDDEDEFDRSVF